MAGRGATTFQKRQKEQQRKEKRAEKLARREQRKQNPIGGNVIDTSPSELDDDIDLDLQSIPEISRAEQVLPE